MVSLAALKANLSFSADSYPLVNCEIPTWKNLTYQVNNVHEKSNFADGFKIQ